MAMEIWDIERVARELNPDTPLTPGGARKEMSRAGIKVIHGYPARLVRAYLRNRRGRGFRSDLETTKD